MYVELPYVQHLYEIFNFLFLKSNITLYIAFLRYVKQDEFHAFSESLNAINIIVSLRDTRFLLQK